MTALHIAAGRDHLRLAQILVEHGASFVPDRQGRMPSTIAAECEASEEMCDFIVEAEAKAEGV
jgi:ankyrin repeat protein